MLRDPSRRRFLVSTAASLALVDLPAALAASAPSGGLAVPAPASSLSTLVVNYATYVPDRGRVDASRAEHQAYADALREGGRLAMGGPLLGDDGRPAGVLLVYAVASRQQAETLAQEDPFVLEGAIADRRLAEWSVTDGNAELLAASLVPADRRVSPEASRASGAASLDRDAQPARTYVNYARFVPDRSRVERARPAHQSYARRIEADGQLIMAGPFADGSGALVVYRARSKDEAMMLVLQDPYHAEGVFETTALSEWRVFGLNAGLIRSH